ncbi:MAG: amidohydrolase family protein [Clostridia bacterium]|nr:amidohydrolase family protein [Clostridia bacterium]
MIIRGGHILDMASGTDTVGDLRIEDGRISGIGHVDLSGASDVIDAAGKYVVPGLIDFHVHAFEGGSMFGCDTDMEIPSGVTTAVDAGTTGCAAYESMHSLIHSRKMRIFSLLNISSMGQLGKGFNENMDPELVQAEKITELVKKYPDEIRGIKVRISRNIVGSWGDVPLRKAIETAGKLGLPVCVHSTDPCIPMEDVACILRKGDILCHVFHGLGSTILDEAGHVKAGLRKAHDRGVLMDAANGRNNFAFGVAREALAQSFLPDIISTDLTAATMSQGKTVRNLLFVMSKYLNMGMSIAEVVERTTAVPARAIGLTDGSGSLAAGGRADVAVLDLIDQECDFADSKKEILHGTKMLTCLMTVQNGQILYDSNQLAHA